MKQELIAGLLAGLVLAVVFVLYLIVRGRALVAFFQELDSNMAHLPGRALYWMLLAGFTAAALLFGLLAGLVYSWMGSATTFALLGLGAAVLLSVLAMLNRTPLLSDKIAWNFAVGAVLGLLVPLL